MMTDEQSGCVVPSGRVAPLAAALASAMARGPVQPQIRIDVNARVNRHASAGGAVQRFMEAMCRG